MKFDKGLLYRECEKATLWVKLPGLELDSIMKI